MYYAEDTCGARLEPVLNSKLALLAATDVPRYQCYPLGDSRQIMFDIALEAPMLWGSKRVDHQLYFPSGNNNNNQKFILIFSNSCIKNIYKTQKFFLDLINVPPTALPSIIHSSYWESQDVGAFILRQFIRNDDIVFSLNFARVTQQNYAKSLRSCAMDADLELPALGSWLKRRTRFKVFF